MRYKLKELLSIIRGVERIEVYVMGGSKGGKLFERAADEGVLFYTQRRAVAG